MRRRFVFGKTDQRHLQAAADDCGNIAQRFGLANAMFGMGFITAPALGGALGDYWLRLPFIAAAVLNAGNLLLARLRFKHATVGATSQYPVLPP